MSVSDLALRGETPHGTWVCGVVMRRSNRRVCGVWVVRVSAECGCRLLFRGWRGAVLRVAVSWQDEQGGIDEACTLLECHVHAACRSVDLEFRWFYCAFYDSVVRIVSFLLHRHCGKKWQGSKTHYQILISDLYEAKHRGMWTRRVLESVLQKT